jgi:hypothetical protein
LGGCVGDGGEDGRAGSGDVEGEDRRRGEGPEIVYDVRRPKGLVAGGR